MHWIWVTSACTPLTKGSKLLEDQLRKCGRNGFCTLERMAVMMARGVHADVSGLWVYQWLDTGRQVSMQCLSLCVSGVGPWRAAEVLGLTSVNIGNPASVSSESRLHRHRLSTGILEFLGVDWHRLLVGVGWCRGLLLTVSDFVIDCITVFYFCAFLSISCHLSPVCLLAATWSLKSPEFFFKHMVLVLKMGAKVPICA